jgi:hypothetical protein
MPHASALIRIPAFHVTNLIDGGMDSWKELAEVFFMCRMGKNLARLEQDRTQYDRGRFAMLAEKLFLTDREDRVVACRGFEIA